jgi:hypothetical protein
MLLNAANPLLALAPSLTIHSGAQAIFYRFLPSLASPALPRCFPEKRREPASRAASDRLFDAVLLPRRNENAEINENTGVRACCI